MSADDRLGWMAWIYDAVRRHIVRHGHRMVQASGTLSNLYVSLHEARALLGPGVVPEPPPMPPLPGRPPRGGPFEGAEDPAAVAFATFAAQLTGQDSTPWDRLHARFRLTDAELRLLLCAAAPSLSIDLARLYTFAWADFAVKRPTVGFLCELAADAPGDATHLAGLFGPESRLVRHRLVELRDESTWGAPTPVLHRAVVVAEPVVELLRSGRPPHTMPHRVLNACRARSAAEAPARDSLTLPAPFLEDLEHVVARAVHPTSAGRPRLLLVGPAGSGRRSALASLLGPRGYGTVTVDLERLPESPEAFAEELAEAGREALLRRSALVLRGDTLFDLTERWTAVAAHFARLVDQHEGVVAITARVPVTSLHREVRDLYDLALVVPATSEQRVVWRRALEGLNWPLEPDLAEKLARRFTVSPGIVRVAVDEARARAAVGARGAELPPLTVDLVAQAVRRRLDHALSAVAEPYTTTLSWDDVVLAPEVLETLREILSQARNREKVFDDWGFRRKLSYGRGLACLFSGAPGTGKTMMAGIMARELGQEIYRVDLARVVSKWVGETEKNLARVFDEAESAQVILLFDEADSLFSTRTEVKGSNDRFANMEINYLLQRMESYDGMTILTTNFEKSIDEAFKRRLKFRLHFPVPDADLRTQLWRSMLPTQATVADDVRFEFLGKKFTMSGGNIKNAVVRAAFYAAEGEGVITHALLERAATAEAREMGRLV
ncbi:MAG: ATP-binding protein [Bradymonadia bacterium]